MEVSLPHPPLPPFCDRYLVEGGGFGPLPSAAATPGDPHRRNRDPYASLFLDALNLPSIHPHCLRAGAAPARAARGEGRRPYLPPRNRSRDSLTTTTSEE